MATEAHSAPQPSRRQATMRDVARRAGVSTATVSRVLAGKPLTDSTRTKVLLAAKELHYVVNAHARALKGGRSNTVGIVLVTLSGGPYNEIARGIEQQAAAEGMRCMVASSQADDDRELSLAAAMAEQNADIVILIGGVRDTPRYRTRVAALARELDTAGSRLVLVGRPSPGPDLPLTVVDYDNEGGAFAITSHLLSAGHERILFLGGPENSTTAGRVAGHLRALESYGLRPDPALIVNRGNHNDMGPAGIREILRGRPADVTAVFAWDDDVAGSALTQLRADGVPVPEEISVVGFNNSLPHAEHLFPALTTVQIPFLELGRTAVKLAVQRDEPDHRHAQQVVLGTHVVVRDSVRPRIRRA
ncbi:LacI family transcriptional regulator [Streptomyces sp. Je 1-79]|uniref:LacI family DNA-binding transcriptional regulator n=1 Tax=Streptomyces sp. Je 1-79 TaxID=2943847 RepID=UPI0021A856DD|nr:LacI family DNA-binding transcriptional regulator [Streptomyces sp. Je 1-79]MCT4351796.1 LacI family transcriptional regulator [Streptomyces sp. Je 1-79]